MSRLDKPKVVVTANDVFPVDESVVKETLKEKVTYVILKLPHKSLTHDEEDSLILELQDKQAMLIRSGIITRRVIIGSPKLRIIAVHGAGVDQVDVAAATEVGTIVTNAPGASANGVAELVLGLMIALLRQIVQSSWLVQHKRKWGEARYMGTELHGKTIGIVGYGNVGRRVTSLAQAFGMKVLVSDPYVSTQIVESSGAIIRDLSSVLDTSDIISIHIPLSEKTQHLIGQRELELMKRGAFLINASRGPVVDEHALYQSLVNGHLAGAALDVMEEEPPTPKNPLFTLPNVILTPHIGGSTTESLATTARITCEDILRVFQGVVPQNLVNPKVLERRGGLD